MKVLFIYSIALISSISNVFGNDGMSNDLTNKECFIWFETNSESLLNRYIEESHAWSKIGKPIITARSHNVESFTNRLINSHPTLISGFKTSDIFNETGFYDFNAWSKVAEIARNVSNITDGRPVILENEGAIKNFINKGSAVINYDLLLEVISAQEWPEIWFWYAPAGRKEPVQSISMDFARAISMGIPRSRLIEASSAGFIGSPYNKVSQSNLNKTIELDKNPISIIYLDNEKRNFWKLADTWRAVQAAKGSTVIIYPGFNDLYRWEELEKISLSELCRGGIPSSMSN